MEGERRKREREKEKKREKVRERTLGVLAMSAMESGIGGRQSRCESGQPKENRSQQGENGIMDDGSQKESGN